MTPPERHRLTDTTGSPQTRSLAVSDAFAVASDRPETFPPPSPVGPCDAPGGAQYQGDTMSKTLLSLALGLSLVAAPALAKNPMVGGAPMYARRPS